MRSKIRRRRRSPLAGIVPHKDAPAVPCESIVDTRPPVGCKGVMPALSVSWLGLCTL